MKFAFRFTALLSILALCLGISSAQTTEEQSAEAFLMDYINLINTGDYETAYAMIDNRSDSYDEFVAGYENTLYIVPYFGISEGAAGSVYVTSVLLGYQLDGSVETYYGYFQLHSGAVYTPIRNNGGWVLGSASFQLLLDDAVLSNDAIDELLQSSWDESVDVSDSLVDFAEVNNDPTRVLLEYFFNINEGGYENAYAMWVDDGYIMPYADFVEGYADTVYVTTYTAEKQAVPQSNLIYLPAVLVAEHDDGSFETYSGCYVMHDTSQNTDVIINGSFSLLMDDVPASDELFETLANLDCASLDIGM